MQNEVAFKDKVLLCSDASAQHERAWSVLAHLSVFVNLVTGFLGPAAALILRLTRGRRSSRVGRQAMCSFWNQVVWLLLVAPVGFLFTISLLLFFPVPDESLLILLVAVAATWLAVPFVEGAWAAYRASRDEDYRYLLDRLTSVGGGEKARRAKRKSKTGFFDDDSYNEDDFDTSDGDAFSGDDFSGGDSASGDFGGGDSGSW
jgi:hypothetical protein